MAEGLNTEVEVATLNSVILLFTEYLTSLVKRIDDPVQDREKLRLGLLEL